VISKYNSYYSKIYFLLHLSIPIKVSENKPKITPPNLLNGNSECLPLAPTRSSRGDSARETVDEIVSKPWKEYFDDLDMASAPKNLVEGNEKNIQACNPETYRPPPKSPLTTMSLLEGTRPSSRNHYVTAASNTIGAYLQTSVRRLIPETDEDAEVYATDTERQFFGIKKKPKKQTAKVLFTFKARSSRELTAQKGEQVIIISKIGENWLECESKGRIGILPTSYLELANEGFKVIEYGKAIGKYDFKRRSKNQLSFKKDDELTLVRIIDQNWYEARLSNKEKGFVPRNYLIVHNEPVTNEDDSIQRDVFTPVPYVNSRPVSAAISVGSVPEKVGSVQEGADEVFAKNATPSAADELNAAVDELSSLSMQFGEELDQGLNDNRYGQKPAWVPTDSERYEAIYSFKPQHDDELELNKGDLVYVFEKCTDGWFIGAHGKNGSIGTFPGNYTTKV
jgi:sorbin and SH3 domain-containing protein 1